MNKRQNLSGAAYRKLKANGEREERKCAESLHVFQQKKYIGRSECKDGDAECTSELEGEEHGENTNMVETNIEIEVEEEFLTEINVVKEIEGDNDYVLEE